MVVALGTLTISLAFFLSGDMWQLENTRDGRAKTGGGLELPPWSRTAHPQASQTCLQNCNQGSVPGSWEQVLTGPGLLCWPWFHCGDRWHPCYFSWEWVSGRLQWHKGPLNYLLNQIPFSFHDHGRMYKILWAPFKEGMVRGLYPQIVWLLSLIKWLNGMGPKQFVLKFKFLMKVNA